MQVSEFVAQRIDAWFGMISSAKISAAALFFALIVLIDLARRGWRFSWTQRAVASTSATIAIFHINFLMIPVILLCSEYFRQAYELLSIPRVSTDVWSRVPWYVLLLVAILTHDLADYCNHRLMHNRFLWPVHAIHHSDPEVNGLTGYRVHMLEALVMWISYTLLLTWLGFPDDVMTGGAVFIALHQVYIHTHLDWDHGIFHLLLASPRFHRWHHADVTEAHGKNLASIFPFFDWCFGTYYDGGPCGAPMGATGVPENDVAKLILFPFREWGRMLVTVAARIWSVLRERFLALPGQ
jgi:sterol desaturase/sphingolipid hydroxylase (fatty acid hydroxylase superfamily)